MSTTIARTSCLHLHDSYITKFDFVNYAFANLVVAWLYKSTSLEVSSLQKVKITTTVDADELPHSVGTLNSNAPFDTSTMYA